MIKDSGRCFACGKDNPRGLRLAIRKTTEGVELNFVPEQYLEGWQGMVHGGIVATILDELCAWACTAYGAQSVTAELQVRFRRPLKAGTPVQGSGRVVRERGRLLLAESRIVDRSGTVIAEASGKMMRVGAE